MAYDSLTTEQLIDDTYAKANALENVAQAVMRRVEELKKRIKPTPAPTPTPTPVPPPPPPPPPPPASGWVRADSVKPIARFTETEVMAKLRTTAAAPDNGVDPVGAFRLNDKPFKAGLLDPFFFPGQFPVNHDHTFYGNPNADQNSTYESLRRSGTASSFAGEMDGGLIWFPTLYAKDKNTGKLRRSLDATLIRYYKAVPDVAFWPEIMVRSPGFKAFVDGLSAQDRAWYEFHRLVELPAGLRFIAGVTNGTHRHVLFKPGQAERSSQVLSDLIPLMAPGDKLSIEVSSSPLWDGVHIDSPDHSAHMAPAMRDGNYRLVTSPAFPKRLTVITMKTEHVLADWMDFSSLAISSDLQTGKPAGSTSHAEYVEGWEPAVRKQWHDNAINKHLNCSAANLGNGLACVHGPDPDPATVAARFPEGPAYV